MHPEEHKKSFIEELQSLEEPVKRKIFIIAIVVIMAIVVYLWFGYFNGLVLANSQSQAPAVDESGNIGSEFMGLVHWVKNIFEGPGQYSVQPYHG